MKIGYVTADWSDIPDPITGFPTMGGAGWYRCGMPAKYLSEQGIETVAGELFSFNSAGEIWLHDWAGNCHDDCDILVFQRWMHETAPGVLKKARACGQIIVNDLDDWYWGLHPDNHAYKASHPRLHPDCNRDHYWEALKASDYITTSTPYLAGKIERLGVPIVVIRNAIDLDRWTFEPPRKDHPVIGWVGSTTHRSGDLETLSGVLGPFCQKHSIPFLHGGHWWDSPTAGDLAKVPKDLQQLKEIVSILDYPTLFRGIDIGIVPLSMNAFNESKSFIKGLEYAASGVPFVAQNTSEYTYLADHGIGRVAKRPKDWIKNLNALLDNDLRLEEAKINRERVQDHDIAVRGIDWVKAYESMI